MRLAETAAVGVERELGWLGREGGDDGRPRQRVGQQESCLLMSCEFYVAIKLLCGHVGR